MSIRTIMPGERGADFSYSKPPPDVLASMGYTFCAGYSSFNPGKNCLNPQDYINEGLAYIDLWEVTQTRCDGGYNLGSLDGTEEGKQAKAKGVPPGVATVACCDTNSVPSTINAHTLYMNGFKEHNPLYGLGGYIDTDLGAKVAFDLAILPSAWYWSNPISKKKGETQAEYYKRGQEGAEFKAKILGYHLLQRSSFKLQGLYSVDPLYCIKEFKAWGNPLTNIPVDEEDMKLISNAHQGKYGVAYSDDPTVGGYSIWGLRENGKRRPMGLPEYTAYGWPGKQVVQPLSDADIDAIPLDTDSPVGAFPSQVELEITSVPGIAHGHLS